MKKSKCYVSGKITGLQMSEVYEKYAEAEQRLKELGYEAVTFKQNGLPESASWEEHMVADINLLLGCDCIYMLDNWIDSKGARIEKNIAREVGMKVFFDTRALEASRKHERGEISLKKVENAIKEVMGLCPCDYAVKTRKREAYFARLVFSHHCFEDGVGFLTLGRYLKKDRVTIMRNVGKYHEEVKYNKGFRAQAEEIEQALCKTEELV